MFQKLFLCGLILISLGGCATSFQESQEYNQLWMATQRVLQQNNLVVRESLYRDGTMVAVSQISGDFLNKSRVKVVARIIEGEEGYLEPAIRVLNQWENSDARVWGNPDYQAGYQWINLGTNAALEAKIYNEIQSELGRHNPYRGKAWTPPQEKGRRLDLTVPSSLQDEGPQEERLQEVR